MPRAFAALSYGALQHPVMYDRLLQSLNFKLNLFIRLGADCLNESFSMLHLSQCPSRPDPLYVNGYYTPRQGKQQFHISTEIAPY